nr:uncharacterized protein LOC106019355 isoform X1 [Anas platyrhynchos]XP_038043885.1 uncharacterized protein LOC106019355 isoform X1 [Anas platyrhynchos]XP_038043886.1 uncharacterized protein LOC106019355 isoform X1 [Anas platyrhynchos]XP_038043887.1 uncharacterized protein LOC106019355 isoform X1 [Anas platyrhynchos]XP_038043888.1 uncharacterized protein LOC106019355 isoform X1 [Anas platyrhynchos]
MAETLPDAGEDPTAVMMSPRQRATETTFSLKCLKDKLIPIGATVLVTALVITVIALAGKRMEVALPESSPPLWKTQCTSYCTTDVPCTTGLVCIGRDPTPGHGVTGLSSTTSCRSRNSSKQQRGALGSKDPSATRVFAAVAERLGNIQKVWKKHLSSTLKLEGLMPLFAGFRGRRRKGKRRNEAELGEATSLEALVLLFGILVPCPIPFVPCRGSLS